LKWKKVLVMVLSVLLALPVVLPTLQQAQAAAIVEYVPIAIENPGFEEVNPDGSFPGWNVNIIGTDDGKLAEVVSATESTYVKSGMRSVKLEDRSLGKGIEFKSNKIAIEGGYFYRLSTQVYAVEKSVRIYVKYYDGAGKVVAENNVLANLPKQWENKQLEVFAPTTASYAELWYYKSNAASGIDTMVYMDDVVFEQKFETVEDELVVPYGDESIDLGEMVKIGLSQSAIFGTGPDGKLEQYITTTGSPSAFAVVDAVTGEQRFSERVAGASDPVWGMAAGSDGNIYFGSSGKLYRYLVAERRIENLGTNPTGNTTIYGLKASNDGKIYGSTFHTINFGKVFEYDIASGEFKDLGVAKEGQAYARGLGVTDKYVYVGVGEMAHLMRIDRATGEITEINIPPISGQKKTLSQVDIYNGHLFVYAGDKAYILKENENYDYVNEIPFQNRISPPSEAEPGVIYYKLGEQLFSYNFITNEKPQVVEAIKQRLPDTEFKVLQWLTPTEGDFAGRQVLYGMAAYGETFVYDPISGEYAAHQVTLPAIGTPINTLEYKDGLLYMGGFQRGMSIYDTDSGKIAYDYPSFHQSESIGFFNGAAYFGTYTGAKIYRMDLSNPLEYNQFGWGNPGLALTIEDQNRPYVMTGGDGKIFIGTFPSGSRFDGALTIVEEVKDGQGNVIDVVSQTFKDPADQRTIIGLAYHDGQLFGSTTAFSGSGSATPAPVRDNAIVFRFNMTTGEIENAFTPRIEGIDGKVQIIGELSVGPDGLIWGVLDSFVDATTGYKAAVFAMDPDTMEIVKSKLITTSPNTTSKYRPYHLRWDEDDILYSTIGRKLYAIDPETLHTKQLLIGKTINLMTMVDNGDIYYVQDAKLFKLPREQKPVESIISYLDVTNGSFEAVNEDGSIPGWSERDGKERYTSVTSSTDRSYTGERSLHLIDAGASGVSAAYQSDLIEVIPGREYTAKVHVYLDDPPINPDTGKPFGSSRSSVYVQYYDENKNEIPISDSLKKDLNTQPGGGYSRNEWIPVEITSTAFENAKYMRVIAICSASWVANAFYDEVTVSTMVEPSLLPMVELLSLEQDIEAGTDVQLSVKATAGAQIQVMEGNQIVAAGLGAGAVPVTITIPKPALGSHQYSIRAAIPGIGFGPSIQVPTITVHELTEITANANNLSLVMGGEPFTLNIQAHYGPIVKDVTTVAVVSDSAGIVQVQGNVISPIKVGETTLTIIYGSQTIELPVKVNEAPLETTEPISVWIELPQTELTVQQSVQASVYGKYTDNDRVLLTQDVILSADPARYVSINEMSITGVEAGVTVITATYGGLSGSVEVTVVEEPTDPVMEAIQEAIAAINKLPDAITLADKAAVGAARTKVKEAISLGASTNDIVNLDVLIAAEARLAVLEQDNNYQPANPVNPVNETKQTVSSSELSSQQGAVTITMKKGVNELLLPANTADLIGGESLVIAQDGLNIELPTSLLKDMKTALGSAMNADSVISLTMEKLSTEQADTLASRVKTNNQAMIQLAGTIIRLELNVQQPSGEKQAYSEFKHPVKIQIAIGEQEDGQLLGIYFISEDGKLEFAGGKRNGKWLEAEVSHFSHYGVFEYNKSYADVNSDHWAHTAIRTLSAKHVLNGVTDTEFRPTDTLTRAQFVTMLVRAFGLQSNNTITTGFSDVSTEAWYAEAVAAAVSARVVNGVSSDRFDPEAFITREQMALMLVRAYEKVNGAANVSGNPLVFADASEVSEWAEEAVRTAVELGWMQGNSPTQLDPANVATRAQSAMMLYNVMKSDYR